MGPLKDIVKSIIAIANSNVEGKELEIEKIIEPLWESDNTLDKLHAAGVDNWEGYSEAFSDDDCDE